MALYRGIIRAASFGVTWAAGPAGAGFEKKTLLQVFPQPISGGDVQQPGSFLEAADEKEFREQLEKVRALLIASPFFRDMYAK